MQWDGSHYITVSSREIDYNGPVALCCGATTAQGDALATQTSITNQVMQQGQQVFGDASSVYKDLVSSLSPTVAAGPNQHGFSQAELANLNSQAITQNGIAYKNAKAATGNAMSSVGGGNTSMPSGTTEGIDENLASSAASNTANELGQITQADYTQGNTNYNNAVNAIGRSTESFNPSTNLDNAASSAAAGQASTANQIATQNQSWMGAVSGVLGSVAGAAAGAGIAKIGHK